MNVLTGNVQVPRSILSTTCWDEKGRSLMARTGVRGATRRVSAPAKLVTRRRVRWRRWVGPRYAQSCVWVRAGMMGWEGLHLGGENVRPSTERAMFLEIPPSPMSRWTTLLVLMIPQSVLISTYTARMEETAGMSRAFPCHLSHVNVPYA